MGRRRGKTKTWTRFFSVKTYFRRVAKSTCPHHNKVCSLPLHQLVIGPDWESSSMCAQLKDKAVGVEGLPELHRHLEMRWQSFSRQLRPVASQPRPTHAAGTAPSTTHAAQHRAMAEAIRTRSLGYPLNAKGGGEGARRLERDSQYQKPGGLGEGEGDNRMTRT